MNDKGNSFSNGPDLSAYNGNGPIPVRHGWDCACSWCLQGVK